MPTVTFDSVSIISTQTTNPRFVKHESVSERVLNSLPLTLEDGDVLISERYGVKRVQLSGVLTAATQSALETAIDTFKELFSRVEKDLVVDWEGTTRTYVATCARHDFNRDHFHILSVPWTAEFTVLSGEGKAAAATLALDAEAMAMGTGQGTEDPAILGSKPPKPTITIAGNSWGVGLLGIEFENIDSGEKLVVTWTSGLTGGLTAIIYCGEKKVTVDGSEVDFFGMIPRFIIGTNNIGIRAGQIPNQVSGTTINTSGIVGRGLDATTDRNAQSFKVPYTNATFQSVGLHLYKIGAPGNITVRIETDNGNEPSGILADANATFTITAADVATTPGGIVVANSTNPFTLNANTKYWIVISAAGVNPGNEYLMGLGTNQYADGDAFGSNDSGTTWTIVGGGGLDFICKVYYGGKNHSGGSADITFSYYKTYL